MRVMTLTVLLGLMFACDGGGDEDTSSSDSGDLEDTADTGDTDDTDTDDTDTDDTDDTDTDTDTDDTDTDDTDTDTDDTDTGDTDTGDPAPTFAEVQAILSANCGGCHIGSASGGLAMDSGVAYGNLVDVASTQVPSLDRVEPGDSANSYLWHKINGTAGTVGGTASQMPKGRSPLSASDLATIKGWIDAGAAQ